MLALFFLPGLTPAESSICAVPRIWALLVIGGCWSRFVLRVNDPAVRDPSQASFPREQRNPASGGTNVGQRGSWFDFRGFDTLVKSPYWPLQALRSTR